MHRLVWEASEEGGFYGRLSKRGQGGGDGGEGSFLDTETLATDDEAGQSLGWLPFRPRVGGEGRHADPQCDAPGAPVPCSFSVTGSATAGQRLASCTRFFVCLRGRQRPLPCPHLTVTLEQARACDEVLSKAMLSFVPTVMKRQVKLLWKLVGLLVRGQGL